MQRNENDFQRTRSCHLRLTVCRVYVTLSHIKATNPTTQASKRYAIQFTTAIVLYLVVLFGTRSALPTYHGPAESAIALAPVIPVFLVFLAALRLFQATDEFNRRLMADSLVIAGAITALFAVTYGFIEGDLLPRPSAWWTWTTFMAAWLVASLVLKLRYR